MPQLQNGDSFPPLRAETVNHGQLTLPADIPAGRFSIIIAYRAHW